MAFINPRSSATLDPHDGHARSASVPQVELFSSLMAQLQGDTLTVQAQKRSYGCRWGSESARRSLLVGTDLVVLMLLGGEVLARISSLRRSSIYRSRSCFMVGMRTYLISMGTLYQKSVLYESAETSFWA